MNADRAPLFCSTGLAGRIERAEAGLITRAAEAARRRRADRPGFAIPLAGGVATFAEDGSPFNKVAGLGFDGLPGATDLDEVERAFAGRAAPVQFELAHLGDPDVGTLLTGRGYRLVSFENVLGRALTGEQEPVSLAGIEVRPSRDDEFEPWLDAITDGFAAPDEQGVPTHEDFPREIVGNAMRDFEAAGVRRYVAVRDGAVVGGASFAVAGGVVQLTGAATVPAHRRRGIQTALLAARLADPATTGCDVAVVTTQPGSKSQQNVQRQGFDLLYTRAVLVKEP